MAASPEVRHVLRDSPCEGTAFVVHLVLACCADQNGQVQISQKKLAEGSRCAISTVRRALLELEARSEVVVVEPARRKAPATYQLAHEPVSMGADGGHPSTTMGVHRRHPSGSGRARAHAREPLPELLTTDEGQGLAADAAAATAASLARHVFDARVPKPVAKFVAVQQMAARFLRAGWTGDQVLAALMATAAFTDQAVQLQLNRNAGPSPDRGVAQRTGDEQRGVTRLGK